MLGTEVTEWNSTAADEDDASVAQARLGEALAMSRQSQLEADGENETADKFGMDGNPSSNLAAGSLT